MSGRTAEQWLRAFRDCGMLRVKFDDSTLISGIEAGWIDTRPVDGNEDWLDCWPSELCRASEYWRRLVA